MEVEQTENQEVELRLDDAVEAVEEGSLAALKEKASAIKQGEADFKDDDSDDVKEPEKEELAEAKPATTEQVASALAEPDQPTYAPSFKYVHKGQEHDVDEFLRPLVKDADSEKKIHEISQKLAFVEDTKEIRQKWEESQETLSMVGECQRLYEEGTTEGDVGKLERLVETIGLSDEQLFEIAKAKLERRKMDPVQRTQIEKQRSLELEHERLLRENQQYQSQLQAESRRGVEVQLEHQFARPEVQDLERAYDGVNGQGSFKQMVLQQGDLQSTVAGRIVPPQELVESVLRSWGPLTRQQTASHQPPSPQVNQKPKRVVPNVSATGSSPGTSSVNSLDDLRKIREERYGQD